MADLTLPWPVTVNTYYRCVTVVRGGRPHAQQLISTPGRVYVKTVGQIVMMARLRGAFGDFERLRMHIDAYAPDHRVRDLDNLAKAILDSLQKAGLYANDNQIDDLRIIRKPPVPGGKVVVSVSKLETAP